MPDPSLPTTSLVSRDPDELLTLSEVADILKLPINTLRWWRQIGTGPDFFKIGRHLFTTVGDVRSFIVRQRLAQQPAAGNRGLTA